MAAYNNVAKRFEVRKPHPLLCGPVKRLKSTDFPMHTLLLVRSNHATDSLRIALRSGSSLPLYSLPNGRTLLAFALGIVLEEYVWQVLVNAVKNNRNS